MGNVEVVGYGEDLIRRLSPKTPSIGRIHFPGPTI